MVIYSGFKTYVQRLYITSGWQIKKKNTRWRCPVGPLVANSLQESNKSTWLTNTKDDLYKEGEAPKSTAMPLSDLDEGAMEFDLWKEIREEFLTTSTMQFKADIQLYLSHGAHPQCISWFTSQHAAVKYQD